VEDAKETTLQQGALVFMDALGFNGISQRFDAGQVISKLRSLAVSAYAEVDQPDFDTRRESHVKRMPPPDPKIQLEHLGKATGPEHVCPYPRPNELRTRVEPGQFNGR
jgi:hypothetical protein